MTASEDLFRSREE